MNAILTLLLLVSGPEVRVVAAPDQPIPHVYVDDPAIIEITAAQDVSCTVSVTVEPEGGEALDLPAVPVSLRANAPFWHVLEGIPIARGLHTVRVRVEADGLSSEQETSFCRIDRPATSGAVPVVARIRESDAQLTAVQGIPLQAVCVDADAPQASESLAAARAAGLDTTVVVDLEQHADAREAVDRLQEGLADAASAWVIDPAGSVSRFTEAAEVARRSGSRPTVLLGFRDSQTLKALLNQGAGASLSGLAYRTDMPTAETLTTLRTVAERAGYEGLRLHVLAGDGDGTGSEDNRVVRRAILSTSAGATSFSLDMGSLYDGERFSEGYARVSALAHRLAGAVYVGEPMLPAAVNGHVFRTGESWAVVLWTNTPQEVQLSVGAATDVAAMDERNDAIPIDGPADGNLRVPVGPDVVYLCGRGGSTVADAARATARREAREFVSNEDFARLLPAELLATIRHIASDEASRPERLEFLALLKAFPLIEQRWHAGALPREIAVPAVASLQRLMRRLSVLENTLGEPFVEPVMDILARCGEYCSKYLTNSGDASRPLDRGEAILDIVERLRADAEALVAEGRVTEAGGVAALAEWRARSLQFAEKARRLGEPEPEANASVPAEQPPEGERSPEEADPTTTEEPAEPESDDTGTPAPAEDSERKSRPDKAREEAAIPGQTPPDDQPAEEAPSETTEAAKDKADSEDDTKIVHIVKRGDNPWALGKKYGVDHRDIYEWNGWKRGHVLNVGDKVIIHKKK